MTVDLFTSLVRACTDVLLHKNTNEDVERDLNDQFLGESYTITSYLDETIELTIESINARPKYFPDGKRGEPRQVEANNFFTTLDENRSDNTFKEQFWAVFWNQWITVVRLGIDNGDAASVRPDGLPLGYVTTTTSTRFDGYGSTPEALLPISQVRVAETHELQPDKLEIKIQYNGSVGDYAARLTDAMDLLQEIQDNMDRYVLWFLLDFHDGGMSHDSGEFRWPDEERASALGEYIMDHPVELDVLERTIFDIKTSIKENL